MDISLNRHKGTKGTTIFMKAEFIAGYFHWITLF